MSKVSRHIVLPPGGKDPAMLLEFRCPQASKPIHVEVSGNPHLVKDNWTREIRVRCPHCRAVHWFPYRQGYIEAAISQLKLLSLFTETRGVAMERASSARLSRSLS